MQWDSKWLKKVAKKVYNLRIPSNGVYRALASEYQLRRYALNELSRIFYYQPMFESSCRQVGPGFRLQLCPDSKVPVVGRVNLEIGQFVTLSARATISGATNAETPPLVRIGDHSYLGDRTVLRAGKDLIIGKHVLIATNTLISGDPGHPLDAVARRTQPAPRESLGRIEIGDDVWIAYNVFILGNVTIGEGAVIGANSVVTRDVPPYALVGGNPARVIRILKPSEKPQNVVIEPMPAIPTLRMPAGRNVVIPSAGETGEVRVRAEEFFGADRADAQPEEPPAEVAANT